MAYFLALLLNFVTTHLKKATFFDFAAPKSGTIINNAYLCSVRTYVFDYPVSFRVGARLDRHYSIFKQRVTSCGSFIILHSGV